MDHFETLKECVSESCYNDIMNLVEEIIAEREASNALDNVLGGPGATGELLKAGAVGIGQGIRDAVQGIRDRINAPKIRQQARQNAANAAQAYRHSLQKVSKHAANAPDKSAPAGVKLRHKITQNALKKQATNAYNNYQTAKSQIK